MLVSLPQKRRPAFEAISGWKRPLRIVKRRFRSWSGGEAEVSMKFDLAKEVRKASDFPG